jgi:2-hydroxychromene-2-carboxylate isomerase
VTTRTPFRVDFYFDVVCPYAYLAHTQIEEVCERADAALVWRPILLGGLFREVGAGAGPMATMAPARVRMNGMDMFRWAEHWDVPLAMPSAHPRRTVLAMRAVTVAGDVARAAKSLFLRYWRDGLDVEDEAVVRDALDVAGLDGAAIVARANEQPAKDALRDATAEAAAAGAFGVPTFVVRGGPEPLLLWGQDRLEFLARALARGRDRAA